MRLHGFTKRTNLFSKVGQNMLHKVEFLISNVEFKADIIENIDIGTILVMTIRI